MVKTRRGTLLSVKTELSTGVAHTRLSKRLKKEDVLKNTQTCSPIGAHHSAAIDCSVDVNNFDGSDQSAVKSIRPRSIPRKPRHMMRKTPYRRQPIADQAVNVLRIEDLATECLIAIFAKVEDQAYVRRVIPLVCKRWASIIKSRSDVWKVRLNDLGFLLPRYLNMQFS